MSETNREGVAPTPIWLRYLLFQAPGWVFAGCALAVAQGAGWLAPPWPIGLWLALVAKDAALYPWMRIAHEPSLLHGLEALLLSHAIADTPLSPLEPEGTVRVGAERWRARFVGQAPQGVRGGERVRICDVQGLTLLVDAADR